MRRRFLCIARHVVRFIPFIKFVFIPHLILSDSAAAQKQPRQNSLMNEISS